MTNPLRNWFNISLVLAAFCLPGVGWGQEPIGSEKFIPTPQQPIGWRADGTGLYPGATPPTEWGRTTANALGDLRCSATRPADNDNGDAATPVEYANGYSSGTEMLVIGAWGNKDKPKDFAYLPDEVNLAPSPGEAADGKTWTKISGQYGYLRSLYKDRANDNFAYVVSYVYSPTGRLANLRVGGQADLPGLFWNGKAFENGGTVEIKKGWNRLLCKTVARWDGWSVGYGFFDKREKTYAAKNIAWTMPMPAMSSSTPVIVGERIFTTAEPNDLICLDKRSGRMLWMRATPVYYAVLDQKGEPPMAMPSAKTSLSDEESGARKAAVATEMAALKPAADNLESLSTAYVTAADAKIEEQRVKLQKQLTDELRKADDRYKVPLGWGGGASCSTPVTDGKFIYIWYGETGVLASYDLDGNRQWANFFPGNGGEHGVNGSPSLIGDAIVIFGGHATYGIDKKTGALLWKNPSDIPCYASALTTFIQGVPVGINPDGTLYKAIDGTIISPRLRNPDWDGECSSPVFDGLGNIYFVARSGFAKYKLPASADGPGKVTLAFHLNPKEIRPSGDLYLVNSPVFKDGLCYFCFSGNAFGAKEPCLYAIDTEAGKILYQQPLNIHPETYYGPTGGGVCASLTIAGGKYLYILDNAGNCAVVKPGREFKQIAMNTIENFQNGIEQENFQSSPVFDGSNLYLRGFRNLYCIRQQAMDETPRASTN